MIETAEEIQRGMRLVSEIANVSRYPLKMISSSAGPTTITRTAMFQPYSIPSGCRDQRAIPRTTSPAANPIVADERTALRGIRSQAMNSRPRLFIRPAEEIATARNAHVSIDPINCRVRIPEDKAADAGTSRSQNRNSLQGAAHRQVRFRGVLLGVAEGGIAQFLPHPGTCSKIGA